MTLHTNKHINQTGVTLALLLALLAGSVQQGAAQIKPFGAIYYQNQYLANPAMAGTARGVVVNIGYLRQWNSIPGSPEAQYVTGNYRLTEKVGLGLAVFNEETGLIRQNKLIATYAYHLVFDEAKNRALRMGLSAGVSRRQLNDNEIRGDLGDPVVAGFNDRELYFDGDFGVAFTEGNLTVQAALPNARMFFENLEEEEANLPTFFAAASYKFTTGGMNTIGIEPKVCYRGVTDYDNLLDIGANVTFLDDDLNFFMMYHSSKNATLGAGVTIAERFRLSGMYLTSSPGMGAYSQANVEVGLQVLLGSQE